MSARPLALRSPFLLTRLGRWADLLAPALIVAVGLPMRLANIGSYSGKADEGTRAEQLLLMARGFRPVRDIFASQGPLSLDVFYPAFVLLDETLAGARLAVVAYSILSVLAVYWIGRMVGGRVGGWAAAGLLLLSPTYLENSRLALVEIPAVLPALLALGAALAYRREGRRAWLLASAVALALALAIKPMIVAVVPAVGLALLLRDAAGLTEGRGARGEGLTKGRGSRGEGRAGPVLSSLAPHLSPLVLYGLVVGGLLGAIVVAVGPTELYDQLVRYRVGSRRAEGWSLAENWALLWGELRRDQPALFGLAALGAVALVYDRPRSGLPLVVWAVATFVLLLGYSPLATKHAVLQLPPTALLAGAGLGCAWRRLRNAAWRKKPAARRLVPVSPIFMLHAACCIAYLWALPSIVARDGRAMSVGDLGSDPPYREESALIQALTAPTDYILVDDAYLAFLNRRLMPPGLVDTSIFRIRSGSLSGADVVAQAEAFDVRLMLLLSDNLRELRRFSDWADERFVVVKINERLNRKDRALYLRDDVDLLAAREELRRLVPHAQPVGAELAGQLRLRGFALDQASVRAGGSTSLTVEWEAIGPMAADWHPVTFLRDREGKLINQAERALGGGSGGTSTWAPGRWVFRTSSLTIPPRTPPGEYGLGLGLYDSKARLMATVTGGPGAGAEEVPLASITVR